jgi:serine/threonine protein kinase
MEPQPVTLEAWDALDLIEIRNRAERLQTSLTAAATLGGAVSLADFVVEKILGTGANAFAYLARCRPGGKLGAHADMLVVLKVILHHKQVGATAAMQAQIEAAFNKKVEDEFRGPGIPEFRSNIVHVLGHFEDDVSGLPDYAAKVDSEFFDPNTSIIVLPFFSGGDLKGMIRNTAQLSEAAILNILTQVVDAIVKLQKPTDTSPVGIAHRDLKPDNIFFAGSKQELALADFGEVGPLKLPFVKGTTSPGGAPKYIAPEIRAYISGMADGGKETIDYSKNDVYAIGMIGYAMCTGSADADPWPEGIPPQALEASTLKRIPAGVYSEDLRAFVEALLSPKADQRMTAKEAQTWTIMRIAGGAPQVAVPVAPIVPVVAIGAEPEPEPQAQPNSPTGGAVLRACPAGHALRCMASTHHVCDVCREGVSPGVQLWGCRTCDYDACKACYATLPGQGAPLPAHPNAAKIKQMVEHIFGDEK